jgi:hypothetical protein
MWYVTRSKDYDPNDPKHENYGSLKNAVWTFTQELRDEDGGYKTGWHNDEDHLGYGLRIEDALWLASTSYIADHGELPDLAVICPQYAEWKRRAPR